jgi:predicted secreted protein
MILHRTKLLAGLVAVSLLAVFALVSDVNVAYAGETIAASVDKPFTIVVKSNPSTGYKWLADFDREFLRLESSSYENPPAPRPGKPGRQIFTFMPLKPGETKIMLQYKRHWESSVGKTKRYSVIITAEK